MAPPPTVLVVDDEPIGRTSIQSLLSTEGIRLVFASDGPSALEMASSLLPDLVLLDVMMPGMDGFEVARRLRATPSLEEVPILLVTALDDRASRLEGIEAGADDFITKPFDRAEMRARVRAILRLNRFRRLNQERQNYLHLFEHAPCGLLVTDQETTILEANLVSRALLEKWSGPKVGQPLSALFTPANADRLAMMFANTQTSPTSAPRGEFRLQSPVTALIEVTVTLASHLGVPGFLVSLTDRTAERRLEDELHHAQKMECVGRLAGGVAHDFNNLLTVINGYCSLALDLLPRGQRLSEMITQVYQAGERAASLTRQLLTFSRRGIVTPTDLDLNAVVAGVEKMLRRLIGEHINLNVVLNATPIPIKADLGQLEQVLLNLAVNARDAMPSGGVLTLATSVVTATEAENEPSPWCRLTVSDTGCGMSDEVMAHIFEPFFTTKELGKGTGLGLATVDSIIRQCGGKVHVSSEVGHGTQFDIDIPLGSAPSGPITSRPTGVVPVVSGTESILLAEDEDRVREFAAAALESAGYTVFRAADGMEALRLGETYAGTLHLLVTDAVMPRMGGRELAERLRVVRPGIKLLFSSGYDDDEHLLRGVREGREAFLPKPYSLTKLLQKVREVLDR